MRLSPAHRPPEPPSLTAKEVREQGHYLSDGKRLFRVVGSEGDRVLLENCRFPNEPATLCPVKTVLETMERVVPE